MPSKYEVETKEIGFFIQMTTQILILLVLILLVFSIIFPRQDMLVLTVIFVAVVRTFILSTKNRIKQWKKKWNR